MRSKTTSLNEQIRSGKSVMSKLEKIMSKMVPMSKKRILFEKKISEKRFARWARCEGVATVLNRLDFDDFKHRVHHFNTLFAIRLWIQMFVYFPNSQTVCRVWSHIQAILVKDTKRSKSTPRRKCSIISKSNCVFSPLDCCLSDWYLQQVGVLFGSVSVGIARMCWFKNLSFDSLLMNVRLSRISKLSSRLI